jgi:ribosome maturation factor RimP
MPPAKAGASAAQAREHLLDLLGPLVTEAGYDLEDVAVTSAGRRSLVRVTVDAEGGIDLDAVAVVSRVISDALDADAADPRSPRALSGAYVLEVSSPGVDRPLTEPRHWRRATGRLVKVEVEGRTVVARVTGVDDAGVTLDVDAGDRQVGWPDLGRGKVQVEFNRPSDACGASDGIVGEV